MRELTDLQKIERSLRTTYRETLWDPFIGAIKTYGLISPGDQIAACISGGKDSMLMAKLLQELVRRSDFPFEVVNLVMDPGYNPENRRKIEENAERLALPVEIFETQIFDSVNKVEHSPCYLCARMRRGYLYSEAKKRGCNKIALGHHMNDVIETTLMSTLYNSQLQAMPPKLTSQNFEGMELIRPLYRVRERDIIRWANYNHLEFIRCACRFTENAEEDPSGSRRAMTKKLIAELERETPGVENSIFNSIHKVCIETFPPAGGTADR